MSWLWTIAQEQKPNLKAGNIGIPDNPANGAALDGIFNAAFFLVGIIAVIFLVVGAFLYVFSRGDEGRIKTAKDTILYSVVGLVIAVSAFLIVNFVSDRIAG